MKHDKPLPFSMMPSYVPFRDYAHDHVHSEYFKNRAKTVGVLGAAIAGAVLLGYALRGSDADETRKSIINELEAERTHHFLLANSPAGPKEGITSLEGMEYHMTLHDAYQIAIDHLSGNMEDVSLGAASHLAFVKLENPEEVKRWYKISDDIRAHYTNLDKINGDSTK